MPDKTEEKRGFSMNKCIVGALVLLCLGSLFLSGESCQLLKATLANTVIVPPRAKLLLLFAFFCRCGAVTAATYAIKIGLN